MLWAVLGTTLLAAAATPTPIALTRFRLVQIDASIGGYAEDRFAAQLSKHGFRVTTPADLEAVLGLERQRQLLGCSEDTSCLAEISSALGVPLVVTGRLTRLGKRLELDVRVIRQKDGVVVANDARATDDEARLGDLLEQSASSIADQLNPKAPPAPFRWRLWVPIAAGVASLAGGAVLIGTAENEYAMFTTPGGMAPHLFNEQVSQKFNELSTRRAFGITLSVLGGAFIAAGVLWNALTPDAPVTISFGFTSSSAGFALGGTF
jgi:hypothetical protein